MYLACTCLVDSFYNNVIKSSSLKKKALCVAIGKEHASKKSTMVYFVCVNNQTTIKLIDLCLWSGNASPLCSNLLLVPCAHKTNLYTTKSQCAATTSAFLPSLTPFLCIWPLPCGPPRGLPCRLVPVLAKHQNLEPIQQLAARAASPRGCSWGELWLWALALPGSIWEAGPC